jgi:hypothetical protein
MGLYKKMCVVQVIDNELLSIWQLIIDAHNELLHGDVTAKRGKLSIGGFPLAVSSGGTCQEQAYTSEENIRSFSAKPCSSLDNHLIASSQQSESGSLRSAFRILSLECKRVEGHASGALGFASTKLLCPPIKKGGIS